MSEEDKEFLDRIEESFQKMYQSSEGRIDRVNEIVCKLAESIHDIAVESKHSAQMYASAMQSYDKHLDKLQDRCTKMQQLFYDCQQLNFKLTEAISQQEKTMQAVIAGISRVSVNNYKIDSKE